MPHHISPSFIKKCDLFFEWAYFTHFKFIFKKQYEFQEANVFAGEDSIGLLIEWKSQTDAGRAAVEAASLGVHVANIYLGGHGNHAIHENHGAPGDDGPKPPKPRLVWAITVRKKIIKRFLCAVEDFAKEIELAAPTQPASLDIQNLKATKSKGEELAVVLDDGCSFANERFRDQSGTRIVWLWNQDINALGAPLDVGQGPSQQVNFNYGGQWSKADLDKKFFAPPHTQDQAYRDTGLYGLRRAASHGTHVMDLLAGPENWEIVFVQFPLAGIDDPSGLWLKRYALDGLIYGIDCAGPNTNKIVANISWGPQTGPHDGSSILEKAFETIIGEQYALGRKLFITLPTGNSFESRSHARVDYADGGKFDWHVPPDGQTPAFIQLWWPPAVALADAHLKVTLPSGVTMTIPPGIHVVTDGTWWIKIRQRGNSVKALLVVHPTGGFAPNTAKGQHGRWTIEIVPTPSGPDGAVHVYVARADHNMGARRRAKASHLTDLAFDAGRFGAPDDRYAEVTSSSIRRRGTLNGIATGQKTYAAAGYIWKGKDYEAAHYSSSGPTRGGPAAKPDYACMTDRSEAAPGVRAAGVRTGTKVLLIGTSTAAPQLGRMLVNDKADDPHIPNPYEPERVGKGCLEPDPDLTFPY